mmetsp:Transcript_84655/g.244716  ORF Transcript_84655/g.244716 Transcript_84655/m.244716 type:complete len:284 (-) Transcript_84655:510-1361(-)
MRVCSADAARKLGGRPRRGRARALSANVRRDRDGKAAQPLQGSRPGTARRGPGCIGRFWTCRCFCCARRSGPGALRGVLHVDGQEAHPAQRRDVQGNARCGRGGSLGAAIHAQMLLPGMPAAAHAPGDVHLDPPAAEQEAVHQQGRVREHLIRKLHEGGRAAGHDPHAGDRADVPRVAGPEAGQGHEKAFERQPERIRRRLQRQIAAPTFTLRGVPARVRLSTSKLRRGLPRGWPAQAPCGGQVALGHPNRHCPAGGGAAVGATRAAHAALAAASAATVGRRF